MPKAGSAKTRHVQRPTSDATDNAGLNASGAIRTHVKHNAAKEYLAIIVHDARLGQPQYINCSAWLTCPKIALPFAQAAARVVSTKSRYRTRAQLEKDLTLGFFRYCQSLGEASKITLGHLSTDLFRSFIDKHLGAKKDDGSYKFASSTRLHRVGALREIIEELKRTNRADLPVECDVPRSNWLGEGRDFKATEPLSLGKLRRFFSCCLRQVAATMKRMESFWKTREMVEEGLQSGKKIRNTQQNRFALAVIEISEECGGFLPERQFLLEHQRMKTYALTRRFGYSELASAMYPQAVELVPFVYLLAFFTLFNPQPLLDLPLKGAWFEKILGVERVRFATVKYRAGGAIQRRSFVVDDADDNPGRLVRFILRWTQPLRKFCDTKVRSKLFIYAGRNKGSTPDEGVATYALEENGRSVNFNNHSFLFCRQNGFDWIGLRKIRATGAEVADLAFEGDPIAIRTLLGQKSANVSDHYRSGTAKRRGEAKLAAGMNLRGRWLASQGKIDPRGSHREEFLSAATPGWHCLDPLRSPIVTEVEGRLCGAIGRCPGCALAILNLSSSYSLCRCLQLKRRLEESRAELGPVEWKVKWGKEYSKLTKFWLPQFTQKRTLAGAKNLTLAPFPPLD